MTTYDKIAHTVGLAALGLLTTSAAMPAAHVPGWLCILAGVVAFATQVSTSPIVKGPQS